MLDSRARSDLAVSLLPPEPCLDAVTTTPLHRVNALALLSAITEATARISERRPDLAEN